jgi:stage V sporulation protein R
MLGIEYLWGAPVHLETTEPAADTPPKWSLSMPFMGGTPQEETNRGLGLKLSRVLYTMEKRKLTRKVL